MTLSVNKSMSLVEQKRLQWAREREEMAGLCAPWGPSTNPDTRDAYRSSIRTHFVSAMEVNDVNADCLQEKQLVQSKEPVGRVQRRSPSLPPIYTRTMHNVQEHDGRPPVLEQEDGETETSGYASEAGGNDYRHSDFWEQQQASPWISEHRRPHDHQRGNRHSVNNSSTHRWSYMGTDESNRLRWGDRGVGVGHLWEPSFLEPDRRLPQVQGSDRDTPSWLERGLSKLDDSQVLVINHRPTMPCSLGSSCDNISTINTKISSDCERTYLRGQNVPLEPDVLLERERKRQKALEHQKAIREQLEERDRKRKEERERRAREEREEEERIRREQKQEQQRYEQELSKQREKEEKDARKAKAMREALENAQKLARQEKLKARGKYTSLEQQEVDNKYEYVKPERNVTVSTSQFENQLHISDAREEQISTVATPCNNADVKCDKTHPKLVASHKPSNIPSNVALVTDAALAVAADGMAIVLEATQPADGSLASHKVLPSPGSGVQLALLMPPAGVARPHHGTDERLLTPSRYRQYARGTQTDIGLFSTGRKSRSKMKHDGFNAPKERKKSASLDRPHRGCKLPLRCRSQSQPSQTRLSINDRPKWGVNKPPTQYVKQSERDPYYQRRMRQKLLRTSILTGSNGRNGSICLGTDGSVGCTGGETGTESDTCSQKKVQKTRQNSTDRRSRSPSPLESSFNSREKTIYFQQSQKHSEKADPEKPDMSVIALDMTDNDFSEKQDIYVGKKRNRFQNKVFNAGSSPKKAQVITFEQCNIHPFAGSASKLKSNEDFSASFSIAPKHFNNKDYFQRSLQRKAEKVSLDLEENGNVEQWTSQDILSQLTSLRQGLLIKQQEWETRRSQPPFVESFW
ncbi:hypothetical protein R5R35_013465 [Gryllus longicercus]|uniref:CCDC66 domain-containing protein n=1 Tax=Gryllus longicercus TaxID=2509291 RepID=A0AAN9VJ74_9ORTH